MREKNIEKFRITSVAHPTQIEGRLVNGNKFYIRYRNSNYYFGEYYTCMQTGADFLGERICKSIYHPDDDSFMTVYQAFDVAGITLTDDSVIEIRQNIKPVGWTWVKQSFMKEPLQEEE